MLEALYVKDYGTDLRFLSTIKRSPLFQFIFYSVCACMLYIQTFSTEVAFKVLFLLH